MAHRSAARNRPRRYGQRDQPMIEGWQRAVSRHDPCCAASNQKGENPLRTVRRCTAGSLEIEPGKRVLDTLLDKLPKERLEEPIVVVKARDVVFASDVAWTFLSPAGQDCAG